MNKKLFLIAGLVIVLIIAAIAGLMLFGNRNSVGVPVIDAGQIIGKWKAVSEETTNEKISNPDISIEFKEDGSYVKTIEGVEVTGKYKLINDKILFYNSDEDLKAYEEKSGRFDDESISIKGSELTLINSLVPETIVYKK